MILFFVSKANKTTIDTTIKPNTLGGLSPITAVATSADHNNHASVNPKEAIEMLRRSSSASSPIADAVNQLDSQMEFYERVKNQFLLELDKTSALARSSNESLASQPPADASTSLLTDSKNQLSPPNSSSLFQKRHSTSYEQKFFASLGGFVDVAKSSSLDIDDLHQIDDDHQQQTTNQDDDNDKDDVLKRADDDADELLHASSHNNKQHRHSIAQQLLDLYDYTGEVVGGTPLSPAVSGSSGGGQLLKLGVATTNLSPSRSSSRSSSVSSLAMVPVANATATTTTTTTTTSSPRKSASIESDMISRLTKSNENEHIRQLSVDGATTGLLLTSQSDQSISSTTTPTTVINCLVPTIVVHNENDPTTSSKYQVL